MASVASVIVAGARTPFGKFGGAFKDVPAKTLGAHAIRAALDRSGIRGEEVDYVIMGQVLQAGEVEVVVAGGMESMSEAPYVFPKARFGARMGKHRDGRLDDSRRPVVDL